MGSRNRVSLDGVDLDAEQPSMRKVWKLRNSECTYDTVDRLVHYLLLGMPILKACDRIGLHRSNYTRWMKRGEDYVNASDEDVAEMTPSQIARGEIYASLYAKCTKAVAGWQETVIRDELKSADGIWQKGIALLERRDAQHWGRPTSRHIPLHDDTGTDVFQPDQSFL